MKKITIIASSAIIAAALVTLGTYKAIGAIAGEKKEASPAPVVQTKAERAAPAEPDENTMNIPVDKWSAAIEGYMNSPLPLYDEAGMPEIVESEFGDQKPKTLGELLVEVGRMFRAESPFTSSRAQAVAYLAQTKPIASEIKKLGKPFPSIVFEQDADIHNASVKARDQFKAYVRAYLGLAPIKEPRISITAEQYEVMSDVIQKVNAGELPDSELSLAGTLIERAIQDLEDPLPNSSTANMTQQERDAKLKEWKDLRDRMEASRVAP